MDEKQSDKKEALKPEAAKDAAKELVKEELKEEKRDLNADYCWNCDNHGRTSKLENGVCSVCGHNRNEVHNLYLSADREAKRRLELRAAGYTPRMGE